MKRAHLAAIAIPSAALILTAALAGPLNPPGGPVTSTYKTLQEVEPRTPINDVTAPANQQYNHVIASPGSYYLTSNLTSAPGTSGILISASNVTLDLNGFMITGGTNGISAAAGNTNVVVRNGAVYFISGDAVNLSSVYESRVENISASQCNTHGIVVGLSSQVSHCRVRFCGDAYFGFGTDTLTDCIADQITGAGFGFSGGSNQLHSCTANACSADGFALANIINSSFESCTATNGLGNGFHLGAYSSCRACIANVNSLDGFTLDGSASVTGCRADANVQVGFTLGSDCELRSSEASSNHRQGIHVTGTNCTVTGNQISDNGAGYAALWIDANGCRAEDNTCAGGAYGIWINGTSSFVAKNTLHSNSPFGSVPAGNNIAPLVTNPGTNNFSTMTPWSNVAY
jgi:parallel beta-helix repeat protein